MGVFTTVLITILMIHSLVLVHEWGHFLAARRTGIPVNEFSIGFGWRLLALRRRETIYSLRLIPLGGYVLLDLPEADESLPTLYPPGKRIAVAMGGPLMNLALALIIFIGIYSVVGIPNYSARPVIGRVINEMPADKAGIQAGDVILSVNKQSVTEWSELTGLLAQVDPEATCSIMLRRGDRVVSCRVITSRDESSGRTIIGVEPQRLWQRQSLPAALAIGFKQTFQTSIVIVSTLAGMAGGTVSADSMTGPIGLAGMVKNSLATGWLELLGFMAFLSINLGIFNLLPIPFLDGGRIVLAAISAIRRRSLDPEKEALLHWVGLAFLMILMLYASYQDIVRLL